MCHQPPVVCVKQTSSSQHIAPAAVVHVCRTFGHLHVARFLTAYRATFTSSYMYTMGLALLHTEIGIEADQFLLLDGCLSCHFAV